jgi:hypothetical protein
MNFRIILLASAVLVIIAAFLPWVTFDGIAEKLGNEIAGKVTGFAGRGKYGGTPGAFTIGCAVIAAGLGLLNKKWSHIVGVLFACFLIFLAYVIYNKDVKCESALDGALQVCTKAGIGSYLTFLGGFLLVVGNILGFIKPAQPAITPEN